MKIIADNEVLQFLKGYLADKQDKVVRIKLADACCGMVELEVAYDTQKEDDASYELEGVKFVIKKEHDFLINIVRLERTLYGVDIKREFI